MNKDISIIMKASTEGNMIMHRLYGIRRVGNERALLRLMFEGFTEITLSNDQYDFEHVCMIESECSLEEYTNMIKADSSSGYSELTSNAKKYFHLITALNTLTKQELTERHIWFLHDETSENVNLDIEIEKNIKEFSQELTLPYNKRICRKYVTNNPTESYKLMYITYSLTNKGYDVALKFLEHSDQEKRFNQQSEIATEAKNASISSAKTAKRAIWAATAIAFASIANAFIAIYNQIYL